MGSLNRIVLIGNLGRDAEMRFTATGTPIATFSLATTERFTDRAGAKREDTQWHRVNVWGKTAEALIDYLKKGKQVCVEGAMKYRDWEDKNGVKRTSAEVSADRVVLLGGGREQTRERREETGDSSAAVGGEDVPF